MSYELFKNFTIAMLDYIQRHNANYTAIENALNEIAQAVTSAVGGQTSVPLGLQEIFDRRGLIGIGSYDFNEGTLAGPNYNLSVQNGAYYNNGAFYARGTVSTISFAGKSTGTYYINLDSTGVPILSASADGTTTRSLSWNSGTHVVGSKTLYAGVNVLFDGDDYADMLTSAAKSKTFTKVSDRLEEIEQAQGDKVQTPASANTITIDWSLGRHARILLDRASTTINMTNGVEGRKYTLELVQDPTGGRAAVLGTGVGVGDDLTQPIPLSSDPNKRDFLGFLCGGNSKCNYVSIMRGY